MAKKSHADFAEALAKVGKLADGLGMPVDAGIRETVAALRMNGFTTTSSCEGHLDRGLPYPWIGLGVETEPAKPSKVPNVQIDSLAEDLQQLTAGTAPAEIYATVVLGDQKKSRYLIQTDGKTSSWRVPADEVPDTDGLKQSNLKQIRRLMGVLQDFYRSRETDYDRMISIERVGVWGSIRLQSMGVPMSRLLDAREQALALEAYRAEMVAFAEYLKTAEI